MYTQTQRDTNTATEDTHTYLYTSDSQGEEEPNHQSQLRHTPAHYYHLHTAQKDPIHPTTPRTAHTAHTHSLFGRDKEHQLLYPINSPALIAAPLCLERLIEDRKQKGC